MNISKILNIPINNPETAAARANRPENDAHWYTLTGEPMHEANLRTARKENLLPSITTVIGQTLAARGLEIWKQNQILTAREELERLKDEPLEDFFRRVIDESRKYTRQAADKGNEVHDFCESFLNGDKVTTDDPATASAITWIEENVEEVYFTERALVMPELGLAGRCDALVKLKGVPGRTVIDFKTRKFKEYKRTGWRPQWYNKDILQLSFYGACIAEGAHVANVGINTNPDAPDDTPAVLKLWGEEEQADAFSIVRSIVHVWQWDSKFTPEISLDDVIEATRRAAA